MVGPLRSNAGTGTPAQQARYLPDILRGEAISGMGYSEPLIQWLIHKNCTSIMAMAPLPPAPRQPDMNLQLTPRTSRLPRRGSSLRQGPPAGRYPRPTAPGPPAAQAGHGALAAHPQRARLGRAALAARVRWRAARADRAADPRRRDLPRSGAGAAGLQHHYARAGAAEVRHRSAEARVAAEAGESRPLVLSRFLRAGCGLRPRLAAHLGAARGRPLPRQRPEDLDHHGACRRLHVLSRPHRAVGAQAGRHQLSDGRPAAGDHQLPHAADPGGNRRPTRPSRRCSS